MTFYINIRQVTVYHFDLNQVKFIGVKVIRQRSRSHEENVPFRANVKVK